MISELVIEDSARVATPWWNKVPALARHQRLTFGPRLTVLWGRNGCGKSTLLRTLARLTHCEQGGIPTVTAASLRELLSPISTKEEILDGAKIVGDGKPVYFFDPAHPPGLIAGAFDQDFFREGVESVLLQKSSSGEQVTAQMNRILRHAGEGTSVTWKVPKKFPEGRKESYERRTAALRPSGGPDGPPTLLFDEPDRSISIPRQWDLWDLLARQDRFQIIVATHSPFALGLPGATYIDMEPGYLEQCVRCLSLLKVQPSSVSAEELATAVKVPPSEREKFIRRMNEG